MSFLEPSENVALLSPNFQTLELKHKLDLIMDKDIYGTLADSRPLMALTQHYQLSAKNTIYIIYRIFLTKYLSEEKQKCCLLGKLASKRYPKYPPSEFFFKHLKGDFAYFLMPGGSLVLVFRWVAYVIEMTKYKTAWL